jgi:hypothetical protein
MLPAGGAGDNLRDNADYMVDLTETSPKPLVEHVNLEPEELELLFWGCPVRDFSGISRVNISFWKTIATNLSTVFRSIPGISNQFGLSGANLFGLSGANLCRPCPGPAYWQWSGDLGRIVICAFWHIFGEVTDDEKPGIRCSPTSVFPEKAEGGCDNTTPLSGGGHLERILFLDGFANTLENFKNETEN